MKWLDVRIKDILVLEYGRGLRNDARDTNGNVPVAGSNGIDGWHTEALVNGPGIVVGRKGSAGKVTWFNTDFWPIDTTYYVKLKLDCNLRWVYYLLNHLQLNKLSIVTGVPGLNRNDAYRQSLFLPPPSEQRRIVEILDQVEALRKRRVEADAKASQILPALFYQMFGDPVTRPMGLSQAPLGKLLRKTKTALQSGPFGSQLHNHDFIENESVLAVGIDNVLDTGFEWGRNRRISEKKYQELKKFTLEPGDVLITIMGTIGRTCVFPEWADRAICTKHVYRIQVDRDQMHPEYLSSCFQYSQFVRSQLGVSITGQIVAGITSKDLKQLVINTPPIDLQNKFAELKNTYKKSVTAQLKSDENLDRLSNLLLYRAFTGDLTSKWRQAHLKELMVEMEAQAKVLEYPSIEIDPSNQSLYNRRKIMRT